MGIETNLRLGKPIKNRRMKKKERVELCHHTTSDTLKTHSRLAIALESSLQHEYIKIEIDRRKVGAETKCTEQ